MHEGSSGRRPSAARPRSGQRADARGRLRTWAPSGSPTSCGPRGTCRRRRTPCSRIRSPRSSPRTARWSRTRTPPHRGIGSRCGPDASISTSLLDPDAPTAGARTGNLLRRADRDPRVSGPDGARPLRLPVRGGGVMVAGLQGSAAGRPRAVWGARAGWRSPSWSGRSQRLPPRRWPPGAATSRSAELPGGGTRIFEGKTYVALYGHPGTRALGVLGEQGTRSHDPAGQEGRCLLPSAHRPAGGPRPGDHRHGRLAAPPAATGTTPPSPRSRSCDPWSTRPGAPACTSCSTCSPVAPTS